MARELAWLDIDITPLSEVHFVEQAPSRRMEQALLVWEEKDKHRLSDVDFMIKTSIAIMHAVPEYFQQNLT